MHPPLPHDRSFAALLAGSYRLYLGRPLAERLTANWLYAEAPFCLLAHGLGGDPRFIYANLTAQHCFGYDWDEFLHTPSRLSAEAPDRTERQRLLDQVARHGFIEDYSGIRVAKSGRRFQIEQATVWELTDPHGIRHGQAAMFGRWRGL